jgi:predicted DNA binding protein
VCPLKQWERVLAHARCIAGSVHPREPVVAEQFVVGQSFGVVRPDAGLGTPDGFTVGCDLDDAVVAAVGDERVAVRQAVGVTRPVEADAVGRINAPRDLPAPVSLVKFDHAVVIAVGDKYRPRTEVLGVVLVVDDRRVATAHVAAAVVTVIGKPVIRLAVGVVSSFGVLVDDIDDAFLNSDYYADCLATEDCDATQSTQVLDHTDDTLVLYSSWVRTPLCASIPHIARDHLGDGLLFETRHEGRHYTWRLIHSGEGNVAAFFDVLDKAVGECARMEVLRTADTSTSGSNADRGLNDLPPAQEAALRGAVEHGYYETPRAVDVSDLAEHLGTPRSTLTYRLRRAEEHVMTAYVAHNQPDGTRSQSV